MDSRLNRELRRAARNFHYERDEEGGILFPGGVRMGGVFDYQLNDGPIEYGPNLIVDEFLDSMLEQLFGGTAKIGTYYIAPFAGNVTPAASWTAANFTSNSTEFTAYDEAARQEWTVGSASGGSIDNSASKASFTVSAAPSQTTIWGAGLLSASGKSATTGVLVAANKAATARDNLVEGDVITIGYTLTVTDNS
jgi:hypothetical protein